RWWKTGRLVTTPACSRGQKLLQRPQEQGDVAGPGGVAHAPDTPHLLGELSHTAADLDAVVVEQGSTRGSVFDFGRQPDGGELGQAVTLLGEQREAELLETALQGPAGRLVARPRGVETLLEEHAEAGVQGVDHR